MRRSGVSRDGFSGSLGVEQESFRWWLPRRRCDSNPGRSDELTRGLSSVPVDEPEVQRFERGEMVGVLALLVYEPGELGGVYGDTLYGLLPTVRLAHWWAFTPPPP